MTNLRQFAISRQKFIVSAAMGLAAAVLAACTGKRPAEPGAAPGAPGSAPATGAPANVITKTADVPVGSGVIVEDIVVTQPSPGVFKGFSATCTHAGCWVSEIAGGTISCPCHGSKFNLDGSVARGPATRPLDTEVIAVSGDSIVKG